jgi:hypothetical protein
MVTRAASSPSARVRSRLRVFLYAVGAVALSGFALGCAPKIGDGCRNSTDCGTRGDKQCDTSQPGGYCTVLNCAGNGCPDEAACVLFQASPLGCGYDDRRVARQARSFCLADCDDDSDCRSGYVCADPRSPPWSGLVLDADQDRRVCLTRPPAEAPPGDDPQAVSRNEPGVCWAAPAHDGGFPVVDAGLPDSGRVDAGSDAASDGGTDASPDAGADAGGDAAALDASDASAASDATLGG